jgi:hypothetical protein
VTGLPVCGLKGIPLTKTPVRCWVLFDAFVCSRTLLLLPKGFELTTLHEILFAISSQPNKNHFSTFELTNQGKSHHNVPKACDFSYSQ